MRVSISIFALFILILFSTNYAYSKSEEAIGIEFNGGMYFPIGDWAKSPNPRVNEDLFSSSPVFNTRVNLELGIYGFSLGYMYCWLNTSEYEDKLNSTWAQTNNNQPIETLAFFRGGYGLFYINASPKEDLKVNIELGLGLFNSYGREKAFNDVYDYDFMDKTYFAYIAGLGVYKKINENIYLSAHVDWLFGEGAIQYSGEGKKTTIGVIPMVGISFVN